MPQLKSQQRTERGCNLFEELGVLGHKIFMDNYFTSPDLFDDLFQQKINARRTVRQDRRGMPRDIRHKE